MTQLPITVCFWNYDRTLPMVDRKITIEGCNAEFDIRRPEDAFHRAFTTAEYDVTEISFSRYMARYSEGEVAYDPRPISAKGTERLVRMAFETAKLRNGAPGDGVRRVSCIDKSNVTRGCKLFRDTFDTVANDYPNTERDYGYIDAFMQWLTRNPEHYDVVVCSNMFGDIATFKIIDKVIKFSKNFKNSKNSKIIFCIPNTLIHSFKR